MRCSRCIWDSSSSRCSARPAVIWAVLIEFFGWICPLTPLEYALLFRAGLSGYEGGFITHYLIPWIYPAGLTPQIQWVLGFFVLVLNAALYARIGLRLRRPA